MSLYERLKNQSESLALVGLGYVGMPIAVAFAKKGLHVIGFDLNKEKIALYQSGLFQVVLYPKMKKDMDCSPIFPSLMRTQKEEPPLSRASPSP